MDGFVSSDTRSDGFHPRREYSCGIINEDMDVDVESLDMNM